MCVYISQWSMTEDAKIFDTNCAIMLIYFKAGYVNCNYYSDAHEQHAYQISGKLILLFSKCLY